MLVYGNPVTDWLAALAIFALLYTVTLAAVWAAVKAAERKRTGGDAGRE